VKPPIDSVVILIAREFEMRKHFATVALLGLMTLTSYAASPGTVYESLGGKKAIVAVVDDFVARVAGDNRIHGFLYPRVL
jgi:hypothetical protein